MTEQKLQETGPVFQSGAGSCKLRENEYTNCGAVVAAAKFEQVKTGEKNQDELIAEYGI